VLMMCCFETAMVFSRLLENTQCVVRDEMVNEIESLVLQKLKVG
jgi:hypothetical protein